MILLDVKNEFQLSAVEVQGSHIIGANYELNDTLFVISLL